jgi:hypothetical protein
MKLLPATLASALLATLACSGCSTPTANQSNHWRIESIGPRITYTFFGYDGTKDGSAWHYGLREASSIGKTLRRRLLNSNPDNPLTSD